MTRLVLSALLVFLGVGGFTSAADQAPASAPAEQVLAGPGGLKLVVRAQGPYDADVPLQVVCYFQHKPEGDKTQGAPVELDERLGGAITSLRNRGEFVGNELETLLLTSPAGTIQPKRLLLIGLGDEKALSLATMERVGRTAFRQAAELGLRKVAFAPLLRDQQNSTLGVGDVETAVIRGLLLARDTDQRLQKEGFAPEFTLEEWIVEAGPAFFQETITGAQKGIAEAAAAIAARPATSYATKGK